MELQQLSPKLDEAGELRLLCGYRKTSGAQLTEPRWLMGGGLSSMAAM